MNGMRESKDAAAEPCRLAELRGVEANDQKLEAELAQALQDFKTSMHAWSDAAYSRPRKLSQQRKRSPLKLAAGWALGCMLLAGSAGGVLFEQHHRAEVARVAAQKRAAEQQKQMREQQARATVSDEVLLAGIDSDVSRQVPSAMEPLARMMDETR